MLQAVKEDVFPDTEGWDDMDPEEAAKWAVGSEFSPEAVDQNQAGPAGPAGGMHTGNIIFFVPVSRWKMCKDSTNAETI